MTTATAVCVRANHPKGYGVGEGKAHGYVVLLVTGLISPDHLVKVKERLSSVVATPFEGWPEWYGGMFEVVAVVPGDPTSPDAFGPMRPLRSLGDNRAIAVVGYHDLVFATHSAANQPKPA